MESPAEAGCADRLLHSKVVTSFWPTLVKKEAQTSIEIEERLLLIRLGEQPSLSMRFLALGVPRGSSVQCRVYSCKLQHCACTEAS